MTNSESFVEVLILSLFMFWVSASAGMVPIMFDLHIRHLERLELLASGLLLGTGLTVVIPEGISALVKVQNDHTKFSHSIGFSLLGGFMLMLLIDWCSQPKGHSYTPLEDNHSHKSSHAHSSLTIGLIIHSFADGLAFGASKASGSVSHSVGLLILFAILCHKIPTAVSLSTLLMRRGKSTATIQRSLFLFSIAAPLGSVLTFLVLKAFQNEANFMEAGEYLSALALLISGGTFIYVSCVHLMGDIDLTTLDLKLFSILCAGCVVPLLLIGIDEH